MKEQTKKSGNIDAADEEMNKQKQAVDKKPGEEREKGDKVTEKDLKGKQVDADPSTEEGKPLRQ